MVAAALAAAVGSAACTARVPEPAAARPAPREAGAAAGDAATPRYSAADVRFVQQMIGHHAQALTMTALVPARSGREDVRRVAERIEITQRDEIALMRRWLRDRGEAAPDSGGAHHGHHPPAGTGQAADSGGHAGMPGMLTAAELARLAAATGAEFDRLFLEYMIRHHEGALAMVAELLATPGAGQEVEIFRLVSDVDADQRAEIRRMRAMQDAPPAGGAPRR